MKFASVSQHLNILKNAGVVIDDKRGKQVFYRLACPCITKTVDCISKKNIN
jgi:ArsR family transcriptional regulator